MNILTALLLLLLTGLLSGHASSSSVIHVAVVSCGSDRAQETLALLRSILLLTTTSQTNEHQLYFHLVHQKGDNNDSVFQTSLDSWKRHAHVSFDYHMYASYFPVAAYETLFAPCACQRLFLHSLLPATVERVIYMDADTLMMSDIVKLWRQFDSFTDKTVAAMAAEAEASDLHPYYAKERVEFPYYALKGRAHGLNSGVMLLNLERLRNLPWDDDLHHYLTNYELTFYDQDLLNIYFGIHPDQLQLLSCEWNYRPDHCYFTQQHCSGIQLLHGNRRVFHHDAITSFPVLAFRIIYNSWSNLPNDTLGTCQDVIRRMHALIQASHGQKYDNQCEIVVLSVALYQIPEACRLARLANGKDEL